jgi:hypothetical protein
MLEEFSKKGGRVELYFYPEKTEEVAKAFSRGNEREGNLFKLTEYFPGGKTGLKLR